MEIAANSPNKTSHRLIFIFSIVILLTLLKFFVIVKPTGPSIFKDELYYKQYAQQIFRGEYLTDSGYPPFYPLLLSPAFFFSNWYNAMIWINKILSSLSLIPIWFLARKYLSKDMAAIVVLLAAMSPYQLIYPTYILSENLSIGLFILGLVFSVSGVRKTNYAQSLLLGLVLALCYLTKYLFLPAIPVIIIFWFFINKLESGQKLFNFERNDWVKLLLVGLAIIVPILLWKIYSAKSGFTSNEALGLFYFGKKSPNITLISLLKWILSYSAYALLASAPFLIFLLLRYQSVIKNFPKSKRIGKEDSFLVLALILSLGYWLIAIQHSFGANYNYPIPQYLIGRYMAHITPLYIICGLLAIETIFKNRNTNTKQLRLSAVIAAISIILARWLLYGDNSLGFAENFASIYFNSPDSIVYKVLPVLLIGIFCLILMSYSLWKYIKKDTSHNYKRIVLIILFLWQSCTFSMISKSVLNFSLGLHGRYIAKAVENQAENSEIYFDIDSISNLRLFYMLRFWEADVPYKGIHKISPKEEFDILESPEKDFILVTNTLYNYCESEHYEADGLTYHIYEISEDCLPTNN